MATLSITDLRKGTVIDLDGQTYRVVEYAQHSMGRGGSIVRTKLKNLASGNVLDKTFRGNDKVSEADLTYKNVQFLYESGNRMSFMDSETYETIEVGPEVYDDANKYLVEGASVPMMVVNGQPIGLDMPNAVYLEVTQTEPGAKGDTATTALKPATVATGLEVMVPLFINAGDQIKVDTRSGAYIERKK